MKLALLIKRIGENDATQWITNLAGLRYKTVSADVLLVYYVEDEDILLRTLKQNISSESSIALFALNGRFYGTGDPANAQQQIERLFGA